MDNETKFRLYLSCVAIKFDTDPIQIVRTTNPNDLNMLRRIRYEGFLA